jgi:hypothetical protein
MLKKLIERIDAISDYVNPIVVRDMRRMFGRGQMNWFLMIYSCLLVVGCVLVYFLCDLDSLELYIYKSDLASYILGVIIWYSAIQNPVLCFQFFARNFDDEMFLITPITPRQYLHAYMFETFIGILLSMSLFTPVVLIIFWHSPNFIVWAAIMLCNVVLVGQIGILVILSFVARAKSSIQTNSAFICLCLCGSVFFLTISHLYLMFMSYVIMYISKLLTIGSPHIFWIVAFYIWIPIGSLLTIIPAYRLSLYALKTQKKSIVKMFLFNIFYYILLGVIITLICSGITIVVLNFCKL